MRVIENFDLGFCLGNVVKYILRHQNKAGIEDVKKARWYVNRHIINDHNDVELNAIIERCQAPDASDFEKRVLDLLTNMGCVNGF